MRNSKMTVKFYRSRLNGELASGLCTASRLNLLQEMLDKSENWPEDCILSVSSSLRATVSTTIDYTSRVPFREAVEMTEDHTKKIRNSANNNPAGVCKVDGLGWVMISSNTNNVTHSLDTLKWDMSIGHSSIIKGEKVFILPKMDSKMKTGIMATAENDAFPLSKSTQDKDWK